MRTTYPRAGHGGGREPDVLLPHSEARSESAMSLIASVPLAAPRAFCRARGWGERMAACVADKHPKESGCAMVPWAAVFAVYYKGSCMVARRSRAACQQGARGIWICVTLCS